MAAHGEHKRVQVIIRRDQDRRLDRIAREGETRSRVVRDALDRYFSIVPDVEIPAGTHHRK